MAVAYVLIGNPNTRKSTLLRCLTGCFNRSVRDIETEDGRRIKVYTRVTELQSSRTSLDEFQSEVARSRCDHILFTLWPEGHPHDPTQWPGANDYLDGLMQAGWRISLAVVLGTHPIKPRAVDCLRLPSVLSNPINQSAAMLRRRLGWK
jgi:hypothetical protein